MRYEEIITSISEIVNNNQILKKGLTLLYELDPIKHKQLDEELFIRTNGNLNGFVHNNIIEIELGGILVKFIKAGSKIVIEDL